MYASTATMFQEASRLRLPVALITDSLDSKLARFADVIVSVQRCRTQHMVLHGLTFVALEAPSLGLAACDRTSMIAALERLNERRKAVTGKRADVG